MPPMPKTARDLALAPVAATIDANLQRLRESAGDIEYMLQLSTDTGALADDRAERTERVLALALRDVDLHGWHAEIVDDASAVRLSGGSVSIDVAIGAAAQAFIAEAA